ncbi:MAG: putative zinc-binding protein [Methanoregula sp.]|nr:putative zinc-binding protein [Methanoregula sp.]
MEGQKTSCSCGAEGKTRIIYSCSGIGSNVGQLANAVACRLAGEGYGGGSCLAGVGGGIEKLVGQGKSADERIVIDGCPVACAKKIMVDKSLSIDRYVMITDLGITKTPGPTFVESDVQTVIDAVKNTR